MIELNPQADDQKLLAQIIDFYQRSLKDSSEALDFLRKQGITNPDCIDSFRIGYANRTLGKVLPSKERKSGREILSRLEALNLFRESSGHEHFNGCVVFPIYSPDGTGQIVDLYGQKIGSRLRKGTLIDLFMNTERTGVWNIHGFAVKDEVILCESLFDALLLWCHGYRNVTSLFGQASLSADLCSAFREFNIRRVMTTCEPLAPKILEAGMDCFLLRLPSGLTASDYAKQFEDPAAALGALIRKAEWLGKGKRQATAVPVLSKPRTDDMDAEPPAVPGVADATPSPVESTPSVMPAMPQDVEAGE